MIRRKPSLISIATEETITFLMLSKDGSLQTLADIGLEAFLQGSSAAGELPKAVLHADNRLLIVPDYWVGNRFDAFQARKKSVIAAFIERKLKLELPALNDASDFYSYEIVQGQDQRQQLCTIYLQEAVAYELYRRLETLGISPLRIVTPALLWQTKLGDIAEGFNQKGIGLIHLGKTGCFLYFFFMGQFLFSRHIQLPDSGGDGTEIYNLLNYEINQSFHLYSQKAKSAVATLYMVAPDPTATDQLTELLGREVQALPHLVAPSGISDAMAAFPSCRVFSAVDLNRRTGQHIAFKPLQNELAWRPVRWAGMAVGLSLAALLTLESVFLHNWSAAITHQMSALTSRAAEPPEAVLTTISTALDDITRELARPSGSGTILRTLLAMPDGVSVKKLSLDVSVSPYLTLEAVIHAHDPAAFKAILETFLSRLNQGFNLKTRPLQEKDVNIQLERSDSDQRQPVYQINFGFEIS